MNRLSHALAWIVIQPIRFYQKFITPYTPASCRFQPTCSEYARQALLKHGFFKGMALSIGASCDAIPSEVRDTIRCHRE